MRMFKTLFVFDVCSRAITKVVAVVTAALAARTSAGERGVALRQAQAD